MRDYIPLNFQANIVTFSKHSEISAVAADFRSFPILIHLFAFGTEAVKSFVYTYEI